MAWRGNEDDDGADEVWGDEDLHTDESGGAKKLALANDHVLFLVDGREAMHDEALSGASASPFANVLSALVACMKKKVLRSSKDRVGLMVFGLAKAPMDGDIGGTLETMASTVPDGPPEDAQVGATEQQLLRHGIRTLVPLDVPSAASIKDAMSLLRRAASLEAELGAEANTAPLDLAAALHAANGAIKPAKETGVRAHDDRRIWLFSNDDNPMRGDRELRRKALHTAEDVAANGIIIELWPLPPRGNNRFDSSIWYEDLLTADVGSQFATGGEPGSEEAAEAAARADLLRERIYMSEELATLEALQEATRRAIVRQRRLGTMRFYLGSPSVARELNRLLLRRAPAREVARRLYRPAKDELCATVSLFNAIAPQKKPQPVKVEARDGKPVRIVSTYVDEDTGAGLEKGAWRTYHPLGGENVYLTSHEVALMRADPEPPSSAADGSASQPGTQSGTPSGTQSGTQSGTHSGTLASMPSGSTQGSTPLEGEHRKELKPMGEPLLRLLGFLPRAQLSHAPSVRSSWWLRPEETRIQGSTALLLSLHHAMLAREQVALVATRRSSASELKLALLVPQAEGDAPVRVSQRFHHGQKERMHPTATASGFHLVVAPYLEDLRSTPAGKAQTIVPEELGLPWNVKESESEGRAAPLFDAAVEFVRATQLGDFHFDNYPNPLLQKYYAILESHALDDSDEEEGLDFDEEKEPTKPKASFFASGPVRDALARLWDETAALPEVEEKKPKLPARKSKAEKKATPKAKPKASKAVKAEKEPWKAATKGSRKTAEAAEALDDEIVERKRRRVTKGEPIVEDDFDF